MVAGRSGSAGVEEDEVAGVCDEEVVNVDAAAEGAEDLSQGLGGEGAIS
jgi:hypothetical protein